MKKHKSSKFLYKISSIHCFKFLTRNGFSKITQSKTHQLLIGPSLPPKAQLLWSSAVNALISEIWLESNQCIFGNVYKSWFD